MTSKPLMEALDACDRVDEIIADGPSAADQIAAIEGDLIDYMHSYYTEEETDQILREWRSAHGLGGTAIAGSEGVS